MKFLPTLDWRPSVAPQGQAESLALQGQAWLVSDAPAPQLVARLETTSQFSIRIVCLPGESSADGGRILSIGAPAAPPTSTSARRIPAWASGSALPFREDAPNWPGPFPTCLPPARPRDILYTYDGSDLSLFIDGEKESRPYRLVPGPALARAIRRIRPSELEGYTDVYYALVFFPPGILLGLAARGARGPGKLPSRLMLGALAVAPPWLLEMLLARASGRPSSVGNAVLSLAFLLAGVLWINVRRGVRPSGAAAQDRWAPERA